MSGEQVALAYDAIAADYDRQVEGDSWLRQELWRHYRRLFKAGDHVLDVACGTGLDSLFLLGQGVRVTGVDISAAMVAQLEMKARRAGLAERLETRVLDLAALECLAPAAFDGIISAFAGLNTTADLAPFAASAARLLRPKGRLVAHMLNRFSLWEWLGHLSHGRWAEARQAGRLSRRVFTIGGRPVEHFLGLAEECYRPFAPYFALRQRYGLAIFRPPANVAMPSPLVPTLGAIERPLRGRQPFANWGRFFVLDLERRP
jgi:SAM-dependent methyltransferase